MSPIESTPVVESARPEPANVSRAAVEDFAVRIRERMNLGMGRIDIYEVAHRLGGKVDFFDFPLYPDPDQVSTLIVHGPREFKIRLAPQDGRLRNVFTVAHELGHYILHAKWGEKPLIAYRRDKDRTEWEANWFAAAFLMPRESVSALMTSASGEDDPAQRVANHFGVSRAAAEVRLKYLGFLA